MSERRWTILIVPEGSEAPRTYELSERRLRLVRRGAVVAVLAVVALGMVAGRALPSVSRFHLDGGAGTPAISSAAAEDPALRASLEALRDTIEVLGRRDQQLRLAAGLPTDDSAAWA